MTLFHLWVRVNKTHQRIGHTTSTMILAQFLYMTTKEVLKILVSDSDVGITRECKPNKLPEVITVFYQP